MIDFYLHNDTNFYQVLHCVTSGRIKIFRERNGPEDTSREEQDVPINVDLVTVACRRNSEN